MALRIFGLITPHTRITLPLVWMYRRHALGPHCSYISHFFFPPLHITYIRIVHTYILACEIEVCVVVFFLIFGEFFAFLACAVRWCQKITRGFAKVNPEFCDTFDGKIG